MRNYLVLGDYNALCDRCSFKFKASSLKLEWTGLRVCEDCFEIRHPQELIRVPDDNPSVPWARPDHDNVGYVCNFVNSQGISGIAVAGCARCGSVNP